MSSARSMKIKEAGKRRCIADRYLEDMPLCSHDPYHDENGRAILI